MTECPKEVSSLAKNGIHLSSPTEGTTDIFSSCATGKVGVPRNFRGKQEPRSGDSYAGLYLFSPNHYREYIQLSFDKVLNKGNYYELSLFVSLAESSTVSTPSLSVLLTDGPIALGTSKNLSKNRLLRLSDKKFNFQRLTWKGSSRNSDEWIEVKVGFKAKGFERNIIIGNFANDEATSRYKMTQQKPITKEFAYYYIDDIALMENNRPNFEKGAPYVIEGVRFDTDSYVLSALAKEKIRELYQKLKRIPKISITINGHTDDMGSKGHNEFLSHKRAKAVAIYLVALGFPDERIVWKGHGNRKPLTSKITEEARFQNRRVDFVITEFEDD